MRIYYPINDEESTPALPKRGSLNEAQYSLTTNRLTSNGRHPPSLGEGLGWASTPLFLGGCTAGYCGLKILIFDSGGYHIRLNMGDVLGAGYSPSLGEGLGVGTNSGG